MGKATIVEDKGLGLYSVRLNYDLTSINGEIAQLEADETNYFTVLLKALNSLDDLRRAKAEAAAGANEVIQQWKDALISKLNEAAPEIVPDDPIDPETGQPWEDPDRAQDGPLFSAINDERTGASLDSLTRVDTLDQSIMRHLRALASTGRTTHHDGGWTAADRARAAGYLFDVEVGVGQVQAFGTRTAVATVDQWMKRSGDRARILNPAYTECGVGYVYAPDNPYSYVWGAVFATPGPPPDTVETPDEDPADAAAAEAEAALEKITMPTIETFEPDKLGLAAAELARAALRVTAAAKVIQELYAEKIERGHRLAVLGQVKVQAERVVDAWATRPPDFLAAGDVTDTAEIPGFFVDDPQPVTRTFTVSIGGPETTRSYDERPINLLPPGLGGSSGQLRPVEGMTPASAFHAAAIEPGWARWRPLWRYGTITAKVGDSCALTLETRAAREIRGVNEGLVLDTSEQRTLVDVPISYPPCNGDVFVVGDAVLVLFEGQDRDQPKVIGFKFGPRVCPQGRVSWRQ